MIRADDPRSGGAYHPAVDREESATVLEIKEGQRLPEIDMVVPMPAVITGRVLSRQGAPVPGVLVQIHASQNMGARYGPLAVGVEQVKTDRLGRYRFERPSEMVWLSAQSDSNDECDALVGGIDGRVLAADRTYVRDFRVPVPGTISGRVTDANGKALRGVKVQAGVADGACGKKVRTDAAGRYSLVGLRPGKYAVEFGREFSRPRVRLPVHNGEGADPGSARLLELGPGGALYGIDAALQVGGRITGQVTLPRGVHFDDVALKAHSVKGDYFEFEGTVRKDGRFAIVGLPPGGYTLSFRPTLAGRTSGMDEVETRHYARGGSTTDAEAAEVIKVKLGRAARAGEVKLDLGASISGTLVGDDGKSQPEIQVLPRRDRRGRRQRSGAGRRRGSDWNRRRVGLRVRAARHA